MDAAQIAVLRDLLASTGWVDRTRSFAGALRRSARKADGMLLVGTQTHEPWHLAAHLDDESRWADAPELSPTLIRWSVPDNAPAHLSVSMTRLEHVQRGETVFVVAPDDAGEQLLERVADARTIGATVFSLDDGSTELQSLAHESLSVVQNDLIVPELSFDTVQHFVSAAAGEAAKTPAQSRFFDRMARALDRLTAPPPTL